MVANIQTVPNPWKCGQRYAVSVDVSNATPGQNVNVALYRTLPVPQAMFDQKLVATDNNGNALATFEVTLTALGINVLHAEATIAGDFDSDSTGTIVQ